MNLDSNSVWFCDLCGAMVWHDRMVQHKEWHGQTTWDPTDEFEEDPERFRPVLLCDTHGALESNTNATRCRIAAIKNLEDCRYITVWIWRRYDEVSVSDGGEDRP